MGSGGIFAQGAQTRGVRPVGGAGGEVGARRAGFLGLGFAFGGCAGWVGGGRFERGEFEAEEAEEAAQEAGGAGGGGDDLGHAGLGQEMGDLACVAGGLVGDGADQPERAGGEVMAGAFDGWVWRAGWARRAGAAGREGALGEAVHQAREALGEAVEVGAQGAGVGRDFAQAEAGGDQDAQVAQDLRQAGRQKGGAWGGLGCGGRRVHVACYN